MMEFEINCSLVSFEWKVFNVIFLLFVVGKVYFKIVGFDLEWSDIRFFEFGFYLVENIV